MTTTSPSFFDITPAKDLADSDEQLQQLVQTFETSLVEEIDKINQALSTDDPDQLEFSLHTLKGYVGLFVTPAFASQLAQLYKNCRNQPMAVTATEFNALAPNFQSLLREVRGWLSL